MFVCNIKQANIYDAPQTIQRDWHLWFIYDVGVDLSSSTSLSGAYVGTSTVLGNIYLFDSSLDANTQWIKNGKIGSFEAYLKSSFKCSFFLSWSLYGTKIEWKREVKK